MRNWLKQQATCYAELTEATGMQHVMSGTETTELAIDIWETLNQY